MNEILIICPLVFIAGFIDSIAGGGGLISIPAYLIAGLPVHFAYGTNKLSAGFGTLVSTIRFFKNGHIDLKAALISVSGSLMGSFLGAKLALIMEESVLRYSLMILLPCIAVFILTKKNIGVSDHSKCLSPIPFVFFAFAIGFVIGGYDGFFGPGTGTFLLLAYTTIMGFDMITSTGNAKLVNLSSNLASLAVFLIDGKVLFHIGLPAAVAGILGNWLGSGLAIKSGVKVIKPVFLLVVFLLLIKIGYDTFKL